MGDTLSKIVGVPSSGHPKWELDCPNRDGSCPHKCPFKPQTAFGLFRMPRAESGFVTHLHLNDAKLSAEGEDSASDEDDIIKSSSCAKSSARVLQGLSSSDTQPAIPVSKCHHCANWHRELLRQHAAVPFKRFNHSGMLGKYGRAVMYGLGYSALWSVTDLLLRRASSTYNGMSVKTRRQVVGTIASQIQSVIACAICMPRTRDGARSSQGMTFMMEQMMGYFMQDIVATRSEWTSNPSFVVHHVLGMALLHACFVVRDSWVFREYAGYFGSLELSVRKGRSCICCCMGLCYIVCVVLELTSSACFCLYHLTSLSPHFHLFHLHLPHLRHLCLMSCGCIVYWDLQSPLVTKFRESRFCFHLFLLACFTSLGWCCESETLVPMSGVVLLQCFVFRCTVQMH
jgi:hypothetical protein